MLVAVNMCSTSRHQLESRSHRGSRVHTRGTTVVRHTSDGTASLAGSLKQCFLSGKNGTTTASVESLEAAASVIDSRGEDVSSSSSEDVKRRLLVFRRN